MPLSSSSVGLRLGLSTLCSVFHTIMLTRYAQQMSLLCSNSVTIICSIIINIKINKRPQKTEPADNVVELELLEAVFVPFCNWAWSKLWYPGWCLVWESHGFGKVFIKHKASKKLCTIIPA